MVAGEEPPSWLPCRRPEPPRRSDRSLLRLIAMAGRFSELVMAGAGLSVTELAIQAGVSRSYFSRIFRLSLLAPEITKAIVQGRQPADFSATYIALSLALRICR